jgi:hypothetical protein
MAFNIVYERIDKYSVAIPRTSLPKAPQRQIKMLLESGHLGIINFYKSPPDADF